MQFEYLFFAAVGLITAGMLFKVIRNRGFRGAMFGAPLRRLVWELELETRGMVKTRLKIHVLEPRNASAGPHVGIEVVHSTFGSWQMSPIALTRVEAQKLADQLSAASRESASGVHNG
jgi:hypothetical protein